MKSRFKKVYVVAPYRYTTGGIELSHQLVDHINNHGGDAAIVYIDNGKIVPGAEVTPEYARYNIRVADAIEDDAGNMLVLPEVYYDMVYDYRDVTIGCWWMSVDNHYLACHWSDSLRFYKSIGKKLRYFYRSIRTRHRNSLRSLRREGERVWHFYQSAYAQHHLYHHGMGRVLPLTDYINLDFTASSGSCEEEREDIILYNPKKGKKFTQRLIKMNPDLKFVALQGMSRDELRRVMRRAKLYIDFGEFPGKDRLPREAVMNGVCIITGREGASGFYEDMPIGDAYKYDVKGSNLRRISDAMRGVLADYASHKGNFDSYRERVKLEEEEFYRNIERFFFV